MRYVRLYSGPDGESHFEDVNVALTTVDFAPPALPLDVSEWQPAERVGFVYGRLGWHGDPHPTPRRQFFIWLAGHNVIQVSDGETRHFRPGAVLFVEDTTGKGHSSRIEGDEAAMCMVVQMAD